ncbi:(2Fe-2S) ferredoxin domain-containing protein [Candidatus Gracilibacteria bacterium 28_42_T64]|nr:(2Fe-2S) ferredoxin domain-containing protein [Candidatus Gracilibacteria bacterium 28_42_T64]
MKVQVCCGKTCKSRFSEYIITRLENDKQKFNLDNLEIEESKCMGDCKIGPNIMIAGNKEKGMNPAKVSELVRAKFKK